MYKCTYETITQRFTCNDLMDKSQKMYLTTDFLASSLESTKDTSLHTLTNRSLFVPAALFKRVHFMVARFCRSVAIFFEMCYLIKRIEINLFNDNNAYLIFKPFFIATEISEHTLKSIDWHGQMRIYVSAQTSASTITSICVCVYVHAHA